MKVKSKGVVFTVILLVAIAVFGVLFSVVMPYVESSNSKTIGLQRISTTIKSDNGESHALNADISLKVSNDSTGIAPNTNIQAEIKDVLSKLNFEKVSGEDGIVYMRKEIESFLATNYPDEKLEDVYVTAFISDHELPGGSAPSLRNDVFKGIFKKAE